MPSPVSPTQLTGSSLVLVNAVYFKALWTDPFKFQDTYKEVFHPYDKSEYQVWMMHRSGHMRVYRDDSCCAVSLPYADGEFAMDIVVPSDRKVMKEYLAGLKESGRSPFFDEDFGSEELVELSMPVFEAESSVNLTELLKRCGIPMSGYTRMLTAGKPVDISEVLQSVKVKADEKGTEAAAVTTVTMGLIAMNVMPVEIDRPFIFTIYDTKKGTVYFAGVIYTPDEAVGKRKAPGSPAAGGKDGDGPEMLVAPPLGM